MDIYSIVAIVAQISEANILLQEMLFGPSLRLFFIKTIWELILVWLRIIIDVIFISFLGWVCMTFQFRKRGLM